MKILSLNVVSFGKLKNFVYDFDEQINVVYKDNSFGKTTLSAFITAMFYGLSASTKTSLLENPLRRYAPWQTTDKFGGTLTFEFNGNQYRIERFFGKTNRDETLTVIDLASNKATDAFRGGVGEKVFGLDEISFTKSIFVPQESVTVTATDTFTAKLNSLVQGENCDKALKALREKAKLLKLERGSGGEIYYDEQQRAQLKARLDAGCETYNKITNLKSTRDSLIANLESENQQLKQVDEEIAQIEKEKMRYDLSLSEFHRKQEQANQRLNDLPSLDYAHLQDKIDLIKSTISDYNNKVNGKKKSVLLPITCALTALFVIGGGILAALSQMLFAVVSFSVAVVFLITALVIFFRSGVKEQFPTELLDSLCAPFAVSDSDYNAAIIQLMQAGQQYQEAMAELDQVNKQAPVITYDRERYQTLKTEDSRLFQSITNAKLNCSSINGKLETYQQQLPDITDLQEQIERLDEEIARLTYRFENSTTAKNFLEKAKENLTNSYLPKMTAELSSQISRLSCGEFDEATLDGTFNIKLYSNGVGYDIEYFSRGIREICLFSLRLSLMRLMYGQIPFIMIDDAFVNYDEKNFQAVATMLGELSKTTQIIYFSCHKRSEKLTAKD